MMDVNVDLLQQFTSFFFDQKRPLGVVKIGELI